MIWKRRPGVEQLQASRQHTLVSHLGIEFTALEDDYLEARMPVDDMGDLFDLELDDEDVETVGGLLAKELNMVPLPGSRITWNGLEITAERATPRRHQIDTVLVRRLEPDVEQPDGGDDDE